MSIITLGDFVVSNFESNMLTWPGSGNRGVATVQSGNRGVATGEGDGGGGGGHGQGLGIGV